jgi:hypothetical protein
MTTASSRKLSDTIHPTIIPFLTAMEVNNTCNIWSNMRLSTLEEETVDNVKRRLLSPFH